MPEVAGDAAILVDPFDVKDIAKAMTDLTQNENLRQSLIEKGNKRKDDFNWQKTADDLWESMMQCATN